MKIKNIYVVSWLIPMEYSLTTELGMVELKLCRKENENYIDLNSGEIYRSHNRIGMSRVVRAIPLSEYYYSIGIRKNNEYYDKQNVHTLVKEYKKKGKR